MDSCDRCASLLPANAGIKACPVCGEPTGPKPKGLGRAPETEVAATSGGVALITATETRTVTDWPAPPDAEPPQFEWSGKPQRKYGPAVASLVLGIIGLSIFPLLPSIAAIVLGIVALLRIRGSAGDLRGARQAIAGIALGAAGVLILPVMIAVVIPTFLGARDRASDNQAQDSARNGAVAVQAVIVDSGNFDAATPELLRTVEPSLNFVDGDSSSSDPGTVSVLTTHEDAFVASQSRSGTCFYLRIQADGVAHAKRASAQGTCTAASARAVPLGAGWD